MAFNISLNQNCSLSLSTTTVSYAEILQCTANEEKADTNVCLIEAAGWIKTFGALMKNQVWSCQLENILKSSDLSCWGASCSYRGVRSIWATLGEDGVILSPARYGLTLHRGVGRLLGLGVLRAANRGLPDWINAEVSKASGCTLNQWEEETTGAGQTKKKTFQIAHSTRNTETDTLKQGNERRMTGREEWKQRAELKYKFGGENKQERVYIWLRRSTDERHIEEGEQQQMAHLRADVRAERCQGLPLRSSSSIVVLALSVDS